MTARSPIRIEAFVDERERPAFLAAAEQLSLCLGVATGVAWPVRLNFQAGDALAGPPDAGTVIVASLLPETLSPHEPMFGVERRWRERVTALIAWGAPTYLCTIFRHLPPPAAMDPVGPARLLERIRRLNLFAARLSHETGAWVIDIDRALAHIGGAALAADHALGGEFAAEAAGHTIVWCLLCGGLDDVVPAEIQERAKSFQGDLRQIDTLVARRLARKRQLGGAGG